MKKTVQIINAVLAGASTVIGAGTESYEAAFDALGICEMPLEYAVAAVALTGFRAATNDDQSAIDGFLDRQAKPASAMTSARCAS